MANKRILYRIGAEVFSIVETRSGWIVKDFNVTIGGPYPSESAAKQNLFTDLRNKYAKKRHAALQAYEEASKVLWQLGSDVGGLKNFGDNQ